MELQKSRSKDKRNQNIESSNSMKRKSPFVQQKIISSDDSKEGKTKIKIDKNDSLSKKIQSSQKSSSFQQKLNSVQIAKLIINSQDLSVPSIEQVSSLLMRVRQIRSMKFQNFSKNIKSELQKIPFKQSFIRFKRIIQSITQKNCTAPQLNSIFCGFQQAWKKIKITKQELFNCLYPFYHKIPNSLNKKYAEFLRDISKNHQNTSFYKQLRNQIISWTQSQLSQKGGSKNFKTSQNKQKLIPIYECFDLQNQINHQRLSKSIPKQKLTEYLNAPKQTTFNTDSKNSFLINSSIERLIDENNLKQAQKLIKKFNIPIKNFPKMIIKMQQKYLQYIYREHKIYFVDLLIKNRPSIIRLLVQLLERRKHYDDMMHFVHKYKLFDMISNGQNMKKDPSKIYMNPLIHQDAFGPTQSDVLGIKNDFFKLKDLKIYQKDVIFINWESIFRNEYAQALNQLLDCKQIGLDSQSSAGIHPFDKAKLQIVQIYCQDNNKVFIFDIRSFLKGYKMKKLIQANKKSKSQNLNKAIIKIDIQDQQQEQEQDGKSEWDYFINLMTVILTQKTVYGHCLHSDIPEIFQTLQIKNPTKSNLQAIDSQSVFKETYPTQTKSNLNYLSEFIFSKSISKYQQCSAWDYRPLRKSQLHYAALDAVLPLKLVKKMRIQNGVNN